MREGTKIAEPGECRAAHGRDCAVGNCGAYGERRNRFRGRARVVEQIRTAVAEVMLVGKLAVPNDENARGFRKFAAPNRLFEIAQQSRIEPRAGGRNRWQALRRSFVMARNVAAGGEQRSKKYKDGA